MKHHIYFFLLLYCTSTGSTQNIFDKEHSQEFARYLMISHQYDMAAIEYERLVFMEPLSDTIKYDLLRAYRLSGVPKTAIDRFQQLYNFTSPPELILKETCKSYILAKDLIGLKGLIEQDNALTNIERERYLIGFHFLNQNRTQSYKIAQTSTFYKDSKYMALAESSLMLPRKNPWLAAGLSTVVPGLGKVYTGRWRDGLFATIMVGSIGWRSYRLFEKKGVNSVFGWTFAAASAGFYLGNIWGSYRSAQIFNDKKRYEKEKIMVEYLLND